MASRSVSKFINSVVYRVDQSSLKKVRATNKKLQKEFERSSSTGGSPTTIRRQKQQMDAQVKAREKHLKALATADIKFRKDSKINAAKASKQGFTDTISGLASGSGAGGAGKTAFADMLRAEQAEIDLKNKARDQVQKDNAGEARKEAKREARRRERIDIFVEDKLSHSPAARSIKQDLLREKSAARLNQKMRSIVATEKERTRELKKQNRLSQRMSSSAMQMVGGLVSAFAVAEALVMVTQTGMRMESINKAMMAGSSSSQEAAANAKFDQQESVRLGKPVDTSQEFAVKQTTDNMRFVREEAMRLGLPLMDASHSFAKMMAAAGDKMSLVDLKTTFIGVSEAATVLGLSQEDVAGTFLALQQMMSKPTPLGI